MVGRREVADGSVVRFELLVVVELGAVVEGDGAEGVLCSADDQERCIGGGACCSVREDADDGEAALSFNEGQETVLGVFAHDGVAFPVADARSVVDACRALADVSFAKQDTARGPAAVTFPADLVHDAGEAGEVSALAFVAPDAAVDGLVAGYPLAVPGKHAHDLLWAQSLAEGRIYILENRFRELRTSSATSSPGDGVAVGPLYAVGAVARCEVAAQLAGDRAGRTVEGRGNAADALAEPFVVANEISLFLGELVVRHGCNPFLPDEEVTSIASHPPKTQGVALSM